MKLENMKLNELAGGAVQEHFEHEAKRVLQNLMDINTDPKKKRKITLTLDLTTDDNREIVFADVSAKSTIAAIEATGFNLMSGVNKNGERVISELKSGAVGQSFIDDDGEVKTDEGKVVSMQNNKKELYK